MKTSAFLSQYTLSIRREANWLPNVKANENSSVGKLRHAANRHEMPELQNVCQPSHETYLARFCCSPVNQKSVFT
jgi:hypothetical protein